MQVLILDKNYKFSNVGLRQLMRTLKNDFLVEEIAFAMLWNHAARRGDCAKVFANK